MRIFIFLVLFLGITACSDKKEKAPALPKLEPSQKIGINVLDPYTRKLDPKTFAKFGARMPDVEKARAAGAWLSAQSEKCQSVHTSEVSDKSTLNDIHIFVDCVGGERFRYQESELKDSAGRFYTFKSNPDASQSLSIADKAMPHSTAVNACKEKVRASAKFASTVKFEDHVVRTSQNDGKTWVDLHFKAMNPIGAELPHIAHCVFPISGKNQFEISYR